MALRNYAVRMLLGIMSIGIPLTPRVNQCPRTLAIHLHRTPICKQSDSAGDQPAMTWPWKLIALCGNWVHLVCPRWLRSSPRARIWKPTYFTRGIHRNTMEMHFKQQCSHNATESEGHSFFAMSPLSARMECGLQWLGTPAHLHRYLKLALQNQFEAAADT